MRIVCSGLPSSNFSAMDIVVTPAMIDVGLSVLEETDDRPLLRSTVERAFQEMCFLSLREVTDECADR
jgi:hypothetical protein